MSDPRDDLAALINEVSEAHFVTEDRTGGYRCSCGDPNPLHDNQAMAQAILTRWRLVPVGELDEHEHEWVPAVWTEDDRDAKRCTLCGTLELTEQHRAASELTRHGRDADIYDDCTCAGREQRPHRRSYDGRTDNHGPHED